MGTPSPWPHFSLEELSCRHCGVMKMNADFMEKIVKLRQFYAKPLVVTSAYRCPIHDAAVSGTHRSGAGPHTSGHAIDVNVYGGAAIEYLDKALKLGFFSGFGFNQKGDVAQRFVHLDDLTQSEVGPGAARPYMWTY